MSLLGAHITSHPHALIATSTDEQKHAVKDLLQVPAGLKAGKYVLGWRMDCEATAQVWSNCADITLSH